MQTDYAGLGSCGPDVTHAQINTDGTATFAFTIPDGCEPQHWHFASYEVPDPTDWFAPQHLVDSHDAVYGPGAEHTVTLDTAVGHACQVDMWLHGHVDEAPYAADLVGINPSTLVATGEVCLGSTPVTTPVTEPPTTTSSTPPTTFPVAPTSSSVTSPPTTGTLINPFAPGATERLSLADTGASIWLMVFVALIMVSVGALIFRAVHR